MVYLYIHGKTAMLLPVSIATSNNPGYVDWALLFNSSHHIEAKTLGSLYNN